MTVQFNDVAPGTKIIELGGGDNPHPNAQVNVDVRPGSRVNFVVNFEEDNWPISSDEWDVVYSHFCMEHISYPKVPQFLKEIYRILKSGGRVVIITANTEEQLKWIQKNPLGWDGDNFFVSASKNLFGAQDYNENAHRSFFSSDIVRFLFTQTGFVNIEITPYGERSTDMAICALKPLEGQSSLQETQPILQAGEIKIPNKIVPASTSVNIIEVNHAMLTSEERAKLFDHAYFDCGTKVGGYPPPGYRDFPHNEIVARHVLVRNPWSILELGCGRGYVLKRMEDVGIESVGVDISKHCYLTRVASNIVCSDLLVFPWSESSTFNRSYDFCFSLGFLEHVPEELLPKLIVEMEKYSKRGLHGISLESDGFDKTKCTLRSKEWWRERLPITHEVFAREDLESGNIPTDILIDDGKIKVNVGSFTVMFHHNWINMDVHDLGMFASQYGYKYTRHDVRQGLPFATGKVDLIYTSHMMDYLSYKEGLSFLRDCRRVIKPDGAMRVIVPNTGVLSARYLDINTDRISLQDLDEVNGECAKSPTGAGKFWAIAGSGGHQSFYDAETLVNLFNQAGWEAREVGFRETKLGGESCKQILKETLDMLPCLSLYVEAVPA